MMRNISVRALLGRLWQAYSAHTRMWERYLARQQPWLDDPLPDSEPMHWEHTARGWKLRGGVAPD